MTRVVYAGFATRRPSGGVQVLTDHVRLLRTAGYDALLWLPEGRPADSWIGADVPVLSGPTTPIGADDLLVLPETPTMAGLDPAPGARKVIFNQNHFYTFATNPVGTTDFPRWSPQPSIWVVSSESHDVLAAVLPHLSVALVPNLVDGALFAPQPGPTARPTVSWIPKKRPREGSLLGPLLRADPRLAGVDLVEIVDAGREEVAEILARTTLFVALGHSESFGLPVAEALASGCLVTGYDGGGGHDLFQAPGAWPVPEQRPLLLREAVVDLVARAPELAPQRAANREWVLERHSADVTTRALRAAVASALAGPGVATTATHPAAWLDALGPNFTAYA